MPLPVDKFLCSHVALLGQQVPFLDEPEVYPLVDWHIPVCVCVCVCMYECECVCVCVCVKSEGHK